MANFITILRIPLSVLLLFLKTDNIYFYIIYVICGITDVLDGYIARKTKTESKLGGRLDSVADLFLGVVIIKLLYSIIISNTICLIWVILIAIVKLISIIIIYKKYKTFAIIHTYFNKITGLSIFIFVFFMNNITIFYIICMISTISAIEEMCINIKSTKLEINKKTICDYYIYELNK